MRRLSAADVAVAQSASESEWNRGRASPALALASSSPGDEALLGRGELLVVQDSAIAQSCETLDLVGEAAVRGRRRGGCGRMRLLGSCDKAAELGELRRPLADLPLGDGNAIGK